MQYQRKHRTIEKKDKEPIEGNNNEKKMKTITKEEDISAERKPSRIATKQIKISTITAGKKEIKKSEKNIKRISYTKAEKQYKKIESPSLMEAKPPSYRIRYHNNRNKDEISPIPKEQISGIEEPEYNTHTLNVRKSPDNISYGRNSIENERQLKLKNNNQYSNIPLMDNNIQYLDQDTYKTNTNESIKMNHSSFNTNTNIKSYRPPMIPQNKMSPIQHYDEGNSFYENKRYTEQKNRFGNFFNVNTNVNPGIENINLNISNPNNNNIPRVGRNTHVVNRERYLTDANSPSYQNERFSPQNSNNNQVSYRELKRIVKKFNKVYDPYKNEKGILIKQSQVTVPGASDEIFNNRYRVLSKMNKLSNILLAKQMKNEDDEMSSRGNSREPTNNLFERDRSLSKRSNSKTKEPRKNKRLLLVSLAMMSSKGPNTEDRTILRKNRNEKGGVVDLAQEKIKKNKFKIKKAAKVGGCGKTFFNLNPKFREKAAKIIQAWWKELKDIYNYKLSQIIKIQSIWKGRWVRKNIYDLLYLNYLYLSFCEKIEKVLTDEMTRYALNKLKEYQKNSQVVDKNKLKGLVINADKRRIMNLQKYWEIWIKQIQNEKMKKNKGKSLVQIRADKENKLGKLRTAFTVWKYNIKMENMKNKYGSDSNEEEEKEIFNNVNGKKVIKITKISEKEKYYREGKKDSIIEKDKFKGLLFIIDGVNNYHKKQAHDVVKPKLTKFLKELAKQEKLKDLINKKNDKINNILKKTIYKWLTKTIKMASTEKENAEKMDNDNLRAKMFLRRIENTENKHDKLLLRKYFYRYLKNVLILGKNEEREKLLNVYKTDNNNKNEPLFSLSAYARERNKKKNIGINHIINTLEGSKILEKYMWRQTHTDTLDCFSNKLDNETVIKYLIKIIKIKEKILQNLLKTYLDKWKNNTLLKKNDDLKYKLFIKIIKIITDNNQKKIMSKKLYQWQKIAHILNGTENIFLKNKNLSDFIDHIKKFTNKRHGPDFLDELKNIRKDFDNNELLRKNIIKQDNKNNKLLLKDFLNKWKNKVRDYEIGKLKGKIMLKIYDKYKLGKEKDLLKKYIKKWENNTIFLDKIKNRVKNEDIDAFTKMNNKDKISILLKSLIRNINRKNNNATLRKYFNIWKKNIQDRNKTLGAGGMYILKIFKTNNMKYFFDKLKGNRKIKALKNIIFKYSRLKRKSVIKEYYLRRWIYLAKIINQTENANIIQQYCLANLKNKRIGKRWKKLYNQLKNKIRNNDIKDILEELKKYLGIIKLIKALKGNNKNNIFDKKFMAIFFDNLNDLLNNLNNQNYSYYLLKKVINKQNNKKKNILLKNAINKWKNKLADYEIGKLKGKLLLKMYDKYNDTKVKDILRKVLRRWQNRAIILDNIKNKIDKENLDNFTAKNKKDKITIIIKSIIRNINRKNNDKKLRKYFNIWKKIIEDRNKSLGASVLYIIKIIRINNEKHFFNKLKDNKKEKILKNLFDKYSKLKKNDDILRAYLVRWLYINKKLAQINNSIIIQRFCLIKLKERDTIRKWHKLYSLLKNKDREFDRKEILNELKKYIGLIKLINALDRNNKTYDKNHMKFFLDQLKNILKDSKNQCYVYLILKKIIIKQDNNKNNKVLKKALNKWRNAVADFEIGRLKGKLLLTIYDKYKNAKIKDILKKAVSKWKNNTIFLDKLKNKINEENQDKFSNMNKKDKIIIIMKSIIRNANRKNNDKILRKYFNKWKNNIKDRDQNLGDGVEKILKVFMKNKGKDLLNKLKENKKNDLLKNILIKNKIPKEDILNAYLSRWRYINRRIEQIDNANIIQKFCEMNLKNRKYINKWRKLYLLLRNIYRKNNLQDIINRMKYYIGIKKLIDTLSRNNKRNIFDLLNKQKNAKDILFPLIEIFDKCRTKNDKDLLRKYFIKWRNNIRKKNKKEEALENMLYTLEKRLLKNSANNLADVSNLIKLLRDILKARALYFLRKIRDQGKRNNLYNDLSKDLSNANNELLNENKKPIIDKILRIYAYKILSNLFDSLDGKNKNNLKSNIRDFLRRLYLINMNKKKKKYRKTNKLEKNPRLYKGMTFRQNIKPKLRRNEKDNKMIVYRELAPSFVKYINKIFNKRKRDIFDKIKFNNVGVADKFCKLLKIFSKKTQIPDKEDLVDSLKYYVYMKLTKKSKSDKLYYLIRKTIIRKILNISKATGSVNRLLHLVDITMTHKNIAKDRWILRIIKKWRFLTFVKKMAMKKMELMYKDLHVTYLEMADSVLKDGSPLGPNGANFMHDINNKDKYYYDFYDPYLVKGAKPYKAIKKEIIFEPLDAEIERRVKTIQEIKTINKTKEINKTYYVPNDEIERIKKQYLKTTKIDSRKKTGKGKIKKSGKGDGNGKTEYKSSTFDRNKINLKNNDLRESNQSDYFKNNLGESTQNEIRNSIKSEVVDSMKDDYEGEYESEKYETIKTENENSKYNVNSYKKESSSKK